MDENTIKIANKAQLRVLCKQHKVHRYGQLDNAGMRTILRRLIKPDERAHVAERLSDVPVIKIVKKVSAPSALNMLRLVGVGDTFSCAEIAKRTGVTVQSVRTIVLSCNSKAPSNARFYKLGIRFDLKRGEDFVRRTR